MSIKMSCPSCGKTLSAPDSAAGKKAKCPSCSQIMIVPAAAQQSGDFGAPPPQPAPAPSGPPPTAGGESWLDELDGAIASSGASAAAGAAAPEPGGEARRPCPECGEMIVVGAAKCRFCNAIFDPRLKVQAKRTSLSVGGDDDNPNIWEWLLCILCALGGCIMGIVYATQGKPKGMKMVGISIVVAIISGAIRAAMHNGLR
jgi:predicted RNA-binding Zn-ribbon protein involved in translation (DUF1610 family)